jgi:hypothetical protein
LAVSEELGKRPSMAITYHQLSIAAQARGRLHEADDWYCKALDFGGAAEDRLDTAEPPEVTVVSESSGLVLTPVKAGLRLVSANCGVRAVRSGRR